MGDEEIEITLKDVETAIKILKIFLKQSYRARILLKKLGALTGASRRPELEIAEMLLAKKQTISPQPQEDIEEEITEEELERIRKLEEKLKTTKQ